MGGPRGVQANYKNNDLVFHYKSTIGGIGHNVGGRSLHGMMDGVQSVSVKKSVKKSVELSSHSPPKVTCTCEQVDGGGGYAITECVTNPYSAGGCLENCSNTFCTPPGCSAGEERECCGDYDCRSTHDKVLRCDKGTCRQNPNPIKCPSYGQRCFDFNDNRCCSRYQTCWSDYDCLVDSNSYPSLRCYRNKEEDDYGICQLNHKIPTYSL